MAAVILWKTLGNVYNDIFVEQRSIDWFLLGYEEGSKNRIRLLKKGEGDLTELKKYVTEEMVAFGYMKVYNESQDGQIPPDFVHITFVGKRVKPQERARAVIHRLDIQQAFPRFIIEFEAYSKEELDMTRLTDEIAHMKAMLAE